MVATATRSAALICSSTYFAARVDRRCTSSGCIELMSKSSTISRRPARSSASCRRAVAARRGAAPACRRRDLRLDAGEQRRSSSTATPARRDLLERERLISCGRPSSRTRSRRRSARGRCRRRDRGRRRRPRRGSRAGAEYRLLGARRRGAGATRGRHGTMDAAAPTADERSARIASEPEPQLSCMVRIGRTDVTWPNVGELTSVSTRGVVDHVQQVVRLAAGATAPCGCRRGGCRGENCASSCAAAGTDDDVAARRAERAGCGNARTPPVLKNCRWSGVSSAIGAAGVVGAQRAVGAAGDVARGAEHARGERRARLRGERDVGAPVLRAAAAQGPPLFSQRRFGPNGSSIVQVRLETDAAGRSSTAPTRPSRS